MCLVNKKLFLHSSMNLNFVSWYQQASQNFYENDKTFKFIRRVLTESCHLQLFNVLTLNPNPNYASNNGMYNVRIKIWTCFQ